jgi:hypothetical protein
MAKSTPGSGTTPGQLFIRWFFYAGFMVCSIGMVALLGVGGAWWAPMIGTVAFGVPTVIAYLTEQERQQNLQVWRLNNQAHGADDGGWDMDDNDSGGDPTVPPPPRERSR